MKSARKILLHAAEEVLLHRSPVTAMDQAGGYRSIAAYCAAQEVGYPWWVNEPPEDMCLAFCLAAAMVEEHLRTCRARARTAGDGP